MVAPISHADEFNPFIALEPPPGWARGLLRPLSESFRSDDPLESALFETLTGSKSDLAPTSNTAIFTYLVGYGPSIDRLVSNGRQLSAKYVAEQGAFGARTAFDEGLVETVPDARGRLERTILRVEHEVDRRRCFWVALSDIHGLGQRRIDNLNGGYESLDAAASATETELADTPYVIDDLVPEIMEAAEQLDGTVPDTPDDQAINRADDPLVVDTNGLCPFSDLFENWTPAVLNLFNRAVVPVSMLFNISRHTLLEELDELPDGAEFVTSLSHDTFRVTDVQEHRVVATFDDMGEHRPLRHNQSRTLHRWVQDPNGAFELNRFPSDADPYPAALGLHPWFEMNEEQGSIAEAEAETDTQPLSGGSVSTESDCVEPDEIDMYSDALLLIDALERQDVSNLIALEAEVLVNLYTLCSDVQRNAGELRQNIADVLLDRLHHD